MKIILHIGTYKTGTSSIQSYLRTNQKKLIELNVFYPSPHESGLHNQHSHIVNWLSKDDTNSIDNYISREIIKAKNSNCDVFLLSTESFSSLNKNQIKKFKNIIEKHTNQDIDCIVFFRNVYDYIISNLCQLLKQPNENFFSGKIVNQIKRRLNYDEIINNWESNNFNVNVISYDKNKKNLIEFFVNLISNTPEFSYKIESPKIVNASLTLTQTLLLVMTGEIKNHNDHELIINEYNKKKLKYKSNEQEFKLAKLFFSLLNINYQHEKLKNINSELLSTKSFPDENKETLDSIEDIITCLNKK